MKTLLASILVIFVSACGGGGGTTVSSGTPIEVRIPTPQPFECLSNRTTGTKFRAVTFDVRRDDIGVTEQNLPITSLAAVRLMIDRAQCAGFDTAVFQTNIPIDIKTGALNKDQPLPQDFWQYISYAKSLGMRVIIKPIPVNAANDVHINADTPDLAITATLETIRTWQIDLARRAQTAGVDMIYVGVLQFGIDTESYQVHWSRIIDGMRSVYQGRLIYATCWMCPNIVWPKVDIVAITGSSDRFEHSIVAGLGQLYGRPVMLDDLHVMAIPAGYTGMNIWDMVISGVAITINPDYAEQQRRFQSLFQLLSVPNQHLTGFVMGEYMPWLQNKNLQNPLTNVEYQFKKFDQLGYSLYNNIQAQKIIQQYLAQLWVL